MRVKEGVQDKRAWSWNEAWPLMWGDICRFLPLRALHRCVFLFSFDFSLL